MTEQKNTPNNSNMKTTNNSDEQAGKTTSLQCTADIIIAYVKNNTVPASELAKLIEEIHSSIKIIATNTSKTQEEEIDKPAVPIRKSITEDAITCLCCGKEFKSLKKHLKSVHNLTPDEYRLKWNLRSDYPMVARSYSERRSKLVKKTKLGRKAG